MNMDINDYKKKSCFTTPEGYFEKLDLRIKDVTCKSIATISKKKSITHRFASIMSYAAMIAITAVIAAGLISKPNNSYNDIPATNIEKSEKDEFIDKMLTNYPIDEYTFYCYLTGCE